MNICLTYSFKTDTNRILDINTSKLTRLFEVSEKLRNNCSVFLNFDNPVPDLIQMNILESMYSHIYLFINVCV
jgi:hypothetical protein